jgi:predicted permease
VTLLTSVFRLIVRCAPRSARRDFGADATVTYLAACERAFQSGGWAGLARVAPAEWMDVARAVLALHLEMRPRIRVAGPRTWGVRLWRDLALAARSLRTGGLTTLTAALTLAIGIGTTAAIFSVLDSILWRQVPFRDPSSIVELANFNVAQKMTYGGFRRELILEWRKQPSLFSSLEAFEHSSFVFTGDRGTQMIPGAVVTPGLFRMLGVAPASGRAFGFVDGRDGTAQIAIVSSAFAGEHLGGSGSAIGRQITLDGRRYDVVGVMPSAFRFPSGLEQIWTPFDIDQPPAEVPQPRGMTAIARLASGISRDDAERQVRARGEALNVAAGGRPGTTAAFMSTGGVDDASERSLQVLTGAVCFLFLIVCANVANITLSRSSARARDLATCAALGATPADLGRLALFESGLLATGGVIGGAVLAWAGVAAAAAMLPESMTSNTLNVIDLDSRTLLFLMAGGALAALLSGLAPVLVATRTSVVSVLNSAGRAGSSTFANRFRTALAILEVAVSVLLLVGSALMTRTFLHRALEDPGIDATNLVSLQVGFPGRYGDLATRDRAALELVARLRETGGASSTVGGLPSDIGLMSFGEFEFDSRPGIRTESLPVPVHEVPRDYFEVIGLRLVRGRTFNTDDQNPVVVNERFANKFFVAGDALGHRFRVGEGVWRTVVGIVADTSAATAGGERRVEAFYPIGSVSDAFRPTMRASSVVDFRTILVRSPQGRAAIPALTAAVQAFDPTLVVWKAAMVEDILAAAIARPRAIFLLMSVFAGIGLLLSTAGLYTVLAHLVSQRRREFGVRLALGASASQVRRSVLGRGFAIALAGVTLGLAGTASLAGTMRALCMR